MTEWVEALTVEAWRPGFNPWDPCKGGRREPTAQICPLTPHRLCDMCAHTNNSNNKPDKDTVQESQPDSQLYTHSSLTLAIVLNFSSFLVYKTG